MPRPPDRRLIRYLHGELTSAEVQKLRAELAADPALQARLAELHRLWQGLQPPPPTPPPFGFVPRLQRRADARRATTGASPLGSGGPAWARALVGAALAAGIALGIGLGRLPQPPRAVLGPSEPPSGGVASPNATDNFVRESKTSADVVERSPEGRPRNNPAAPRVAREAGAPSPSPPVVSPAHPPVTQVPPAAAGDSAVVDVAAGDSPLLGGTTLAEAYWEALSGPIETDDEGNGTG